MVVQPYLNNLKNKLKYSQNSNNKNIFDMKKKLYIKK